MPDDTNTDLANAAKAVAAAELAALKGILSRAQAFVSDMQAISAALPFPAGFQSKALQLAGGMASNLSYLISTEIPNAITALEPHAAATGPAVPGGVVPA